MKVSPVVIVYILFGIFVILLTTRLVDFDRELIAQSASAKGWLVDRVSVGTSRWSQNECELRADRRRGAPRYYFVEYYDEEGKRRGCLCKVGSMSGVDWDV
jgi:hypothetical protein